MAFDIKGFFRFTCRWLLSILDLRTGYPVRRLAIFAAFGLVFPVLELVTWIGFGLDDLFFRGYRKVKIESPVFIVGSFRSGTTFLHRLMAMDYDRFLTMKMWEILFAPSIVQRKVLRALAAVDRWLGGFVLRWLDSTEEGWQKQNVMHKVSLRAPEEDDYLLLHIWSALTSGLSAGILEEAVPYAYFDTMLPTHRRMRIMDYYRRCVQRHLHVHHDGVGGDARQYLAKNPALTPKVRTVLESFPDARIICLVRNPLESIPSFVSMMEFSWRVIGNPEDSLALRDYIVRMAGHWYRYPLEQFAQYPDSGSIVVRYDDLVQNPEQVITKIYEHFGFEMSDAYAQVLREEAKQARRFQSRHDYSLAELGLSRDRIVEEFGDIFERFDFDAAT